MLTFKEILATQLLPWAQNKANERFIVARPTMCVADMPDGAQLVRRKIKGKRETIKRQRHYRNGRNVQACWPNEGLNEVNKYKMACVIQGDIDYQLADYAVQCGPGNFLLIPPGIAHPDGTHSYVDGDKSTFCQVVFFLLHANALQCWVSHVTTESRTSHSHFLVFDERVTSLFRVLMKESIAAEEQSAAVCDLLMPAFFTALQREVKNDRLQAIRGNAPYLLNDAAENERQDDFVGRLRNYLQTNMYKKLTLDDVSRDMYMSRVQFTRKVRLETGYSFNQLVLDYRLQVAKTMLGDSHWTVSAIAAYVGFGSASYFRNVFRKEVGCSPTEFRSHQ
jgi:AraC-like DNA-binding protein